VLNAFPTHSAKRTPKFLPVPQRGASPEFSVPPAGRDNKNCSGDCWPAERGNPPGDDADEEEEDEGGGAELCQDIAKRRGKEKRLKATRNADSL